MQDYQKRIWLSWAAPGVWSTGPAVIYNFGNVEQTIADARARGERVEGPYEYAGK